ncbi:MAG: S1/P1 nuclease [Melioribacteraceae bacterium]
MKKIFYYSFLLFFVPTILIFGWGDKGHKIITAFAMRQLPPQMKFSEAFKSAIIEHSVDPDNRKRDDKTEGPKHFIDIDFYKEFSDGIIIMSRDSLNKLYGEQVVTREGILPWATETTFYRLIQAFKDKDKDKVLLYASDLAHYVGDGHQPLHATVNYNGQLTDQKGIHGRYEIEMLDQYLNILEKNYDDQIPYYVNSIPSMIFNYIAEANNYVELILSADKFASKKTDGKFDKEYYRLLWFKTKYITINEINSAALSLSSLIYSAWMDAGKPVLEN